MRCGKILNERTVRRLVIVILVLSGIVMIAANL